MEKRYKVLWIEDESEKQDGFVDQAALEDIELCNYKVNKDGITELKKHHEKYDAIILDAKGFKDSKDEKASLSGMLESIKVINSLPRKMPYFIFSGYLDKEEYSTAREMLDGEEIFTKAKDNEKLLKRIKEEADKTIETQTKHDFAAVFESLEFVNPSHSKTILELLMAARFGGGNLDDKLYFTQLRIILEDIFRKANSLGILHDKCIVNSKVNLSESSLFLSGQDTKHLNVRCTKIHFPKLISEGVKNLIFITGAASHTTDINYEDNYNIQEYRDRINTPYLLFQLTFIIADTLIWFKQYAKENSEIEDNKSHWEEFESVELNYNQEVEGELIRIAPNGWGTVELKDSVNSSSVSVYKDKVVDSELQLGDKVTLTLDSLKAKTIEKI